MIEINTIQSTVIRNSRGLSIAGTRITLYQIMEYINAEWSPKLIRQWLGLTDKQMSDIMEYIQVHTAEVEAEYREVVRKAEENRRYWEEYNRERFAAIAALPPKPGQEAIRAKLRAKKAELGMI